MDGFSDAQNFGIKTCMGWGAASHPIFYQLVTEPINSAKPTLMVSFEMAAFSAAIMTARV